MANSTDFLLALENVSVSFDGFKAVNALNLYVDKGELRVIIGPNGAGKTTVLDLICGRTRVSDGSIKFKNQEITGRKEQEIVRLGIGRKFQTPTIYEDLTVFENLELSLPRGRNVAGALFWKRTEEVREQVKDVAAMIFLQDHLDRLAETSSHGQKQWLEIGMLLIQDPELLMLDEPVAGMSVVGARQDRRAAQTDHQEPLGDRDRARHEVRRDHRASRDGVAPGQGAGRRRHAVGAGQSESEGSLSRPLARLIRFLRRRFSARRSAMKDDGRCSRFAIFPPPMGKARSFTASISRSNRARSSPWWAATAWASPP